MAGHPREVIIVPTLGDFTNGLNGILISKYLSISNLCHAGNGKTSKSSIKNALSFSITSVPFFQVRPRTLSNFCFPKYSSSKSGNVTSPSPLIT